MKVSTVLDKVNKFKPSTLTEQDVIDLINEVETDIAVNIMRLPEYTLATVETKTMELLAPPSTDGIYFDYVCAKIDALNSDTDQLSLSAQQYNISEDNLRAYCIKWGLTPSFGKRVDYF